ncbi:hypothetical protein EMIT0324P_10264 [Pseudomonas chlororaphis]
MSYRSAWRMECRLQYTHFRRGMQAEGRFYWYSQPGAFSVLGRPIWLLVPMLVFAYLPERREVKLLS